ncbi:MAG: PIN domain-containing protein [Planctomycetota bacterium]|jgi:predicted nucleic acid-binding protein|nr:PIN domain-containing protein [Planctomycetota bacterium]
MSILAVLDTNVIVSAGIRPGGGPARIVDAALDGVVVPVICPSMAKEYQDVVTRPKFTRWDFPPIWLAGLIDMAHRLERDPPPWPLTGPDPDDLIFLALAHATGATLVSGNTADFPKRIRKNVTVMTPAEYLDHLGELGHQV